MRKIALCITRTCLYNFDPLKLHFYIIKLGFTGVYIFLFLLKNIDRGYTGTVAQLVERPLCDREVAGSIPSRVIPKTLNMVLADLSLGAQH